MFISKITIPPDKKGCWYIKISDGSKFTDRFYFKDKHRLAKKCSYQYFIGKIPDKMMIFQSCKDNLCINPNHLYLNNIKHSWDLLREKGWQPTITRHTPERKIMMSKIHKGKVISQEMKDYLRSLYLGTRRSAEDRRKISEGRIGIPVQEPARQKIALSKQGEKNYNTKLTAQMVYEIRALKGKSTIASAANKFGISNIHVINIWRRKVWKHLGD